MTVRELIAALEALPEEWKDHPAVTSRLDHWAEVSGPPVLSRGAYRRVSFEFTYGPFVEVL